MFLRWLEKEDQERFIELAYKTLMVDSVYDDSEKILFQEFKQETGISSPGNTGTLEDLLNYFGGKDSVTQKIVLFETCSMLLTDGPANAKENDFLEFAKGKFQISEDETKAIIASAEEVASNVMKARKLIGIGL